MVFIIFGEAPGVLWFASPNAIRVKLALWALRSLRELKGLNARQLAFSRRVSTRASSVQSTGGALVSTGLPKC